MKKRIAFALIMGLIATCIISFTLVSVNVGYTTSFLRIWLRSWALAYAVVIPLLLLVAPQVHRLVQFLFDEISDHQK
jgi:hypothetical protein